MIFDYYFWFIQPSTVLSNADNIFGYLSLGLMIVAIMSRLLVSFSKNEINRKLFRKIWHLCLTIGLTGLIWFGLRFENTPIFAERFWVGLNFIIGGIWALFVLKYLVFNYHSEKSEYNREQIKNRYLPGLPKSR
jgi:hypothetical protein